LAKEISLKFENRTGAEIGPNKIVDLRKEQIRRANKNFKCLENST